MGRIYLQAGHVAEAEKQFAAVAGDGGVARVNKDMNSALLASAKGEWEECRVLLEGLVRGDKENFVVSWWSEGVGRPMIADFWFWFWMVGRE